MDINFKDFKIIPLKQNFNVKEEAKIDWERKYTPNWALPENQKIIAIKKRKKNRKLWNI